MDETRISLLERVRDHADQNSWQEFCRLYHPVLSKFVGARGIHEYNANQDTVQEILIALFRKLPDLQFDRNRGKFRTYLWTLANNSVANWYRKNARHQRVASINLDSRVLELEDESQTDPSAEFIADIRRQALQAGLKRLEKDLSPESWQRFLRHFVQKVPAAEVAAELGCKTNAVYTSVHRALAKLKEICAEYLEELES